MRQHLFSSMVAVLALCLFAFTPNSVLAQSDDCAGAPEYTLGTTETGTTVGATDSDPVQCGTSNTAPGVWYKVSNPANGDYNISLCGSSFDTKLSVYSGTCATLTCLAGTDDGGPCGVQSEVEFTYGGGDDMYIYIHGFSANTGNFTLNSTFTPFAPPSGYCDAPANSNDDDWIVNVTVDGAGIDHSTAYSQNTANTINATGMATAGQVVNVTVDVEVDGAWDQQVIVYFDGDNDFVFETVLDLGVFDASSAGTYTFDASTAPGGSNALTMPMTAGTYRMRVVEAYNPGGGVAGPCSDDFGTSFRDSEDYEIVVGGGSGNNDDCVGAAMVDLAALPYVNFSDGEGATQDEDNNDPCPGNFSSGPDEWYTWVGDGSVIDIVVETADTEMTLFSGACGALVCEAFIDDPEELLGIATIPGVTYYLEVAEWFSGGSTLDPYTLTITQVSPPSGDGVDGFQCAGTYTAELGADGTVGVNPEDLIIRIPDGWYAASAPVAFDCDAVGQSFEVNVVITNDDGDIAVCTVTVVVVDNMAPMATPNFPAIVALDDNGVGTLTDAAAFDVIFDNCDYSVSYSNTNFECAQVGLNYVTATVTDPSGNSVEVSIPVLVQASDACEDPGSDANNGGVRPSSGGVPWTGGNLSTPDTDVQALFENTRLNEAGLALFPNPARSHAQVVIKGEELQNGTLYLLDSQGRTIKTRQVGGSAMTTLQDLQSGLYHVMIIATDGQRYTQKLVVQ